MQTDALIFTLLAFTFLPTPSLSSKLQLPPSHCHATGHCVLEGQKSYYPALLPHPTFTLDDDQPVLFVSKLYYDHPYTAKANRPFIRKYLRPNLNTSGFTLPDPAPRPARAVPAPFAAPAAEIHRAWCAAPEPPAKPFTLPACGDPEVDMARLVEDAARAGEGRVPVFRVVNAFVDGTLGHFGGSVLSREVVVSQFDRPPKVPDPALLGAGNPAVPLVLKVKRAKVLMAFRELATTGPVRYLSFGHFFTEVLPNLVRLYESAPPEVPILVLVVDDFVAGLVRAFADFNVWDFERFVVVNIKKQQGFIYAETAYVAPIFKSAIGMRRLGEFLDAKFHASPGLPAMGRTADNANIVLQIRKGPRRVWNNSAECFDRLSASLNQKSMRHVLMYDNGDLSMEQAMQFYKNVDLLIAAHGAGLSNAVFMPTGSAVIELCHTNWAYCRWFADDLRALGLYYFNFMCERCTHRTAATVSATELAAFATHLLGFSSKGSDQDEI